MRGPSPPPPMPLPATCGRGSWPGTPPPHPIPSPPQRRPPLRQDPAALDFGLRGVLARLRTMTEEDWSRLPDSGGGAAPPPLRRRPGCHVPAPALCLAKTKRYPLARIRRLVLWAFLGLTAEDRPAALPLSSGPGLHPTGADSPEADEDRRLPAHSGEARPRRPPAGGGPPPLRAGGPVHRPLRFVPPEVWPNPWKE